MKSFLKDIDLLRVKSLIENSSYDLTETFLKVTGFQRVKLLIGNNGFEFI